MSEPTLTLEQKGTLAIAARRLGEAAGRTTVAARAAIIADPSQLTPLAEECRKIGGGASGLADELEALRIVLSSPAEPNASPVEPAAGVTK